MTRSFLILILGFGLIKTEAQNLLFIPPLVSGPNFTLTIQSGTKPFFAGYNTPTYGVNGTWMAPTLLMNKDDSVTINVTNSLITSTTIHWHGFHVAPQYDGGPHQVILPSATWSPAFKVRNNAGTFWYHPHGDKKTDLHVSKGIAGMIIVKDTIEAAINLPRTYGVDDIPLIVQSKAFDVLRQIAIATEDDTSLFVNGTLNPYTDLPAQVIRFRMLNGSSMRTYNFGFTGNIPFKIIAGDGGLLDNAVSLTQMKLAPGERAEILLDLTGMSGQTIYLRNFGYSLPNGIYGSAIVGTGLAAIPGYGANPRNGADYDIMKINVIAQTGSPVTSMPTTLTTNSPWQLSQVVANRRIEFAPATPGDSTEMAEGPFTMNGRSFDMDSINIKTQLNNIEIWKLVNHTLVAHPFHMHDIQFYVLDVNGVPPPPEQQDKKDVVLVMPGDSVQFVTKFEDFANDTLPYMYHCHLLHHEDDGMMGSFIVQSIPNGVKNNVQSRDEVHIFPNPACNLVEIDSKYGALDRILITNALGQLVCTGDHSPLDVGHLNPGLYFVQLLVGDKATKAKLLIQR